MIFDPPAVIKIAQSAGSYHSEKMACNKLVSKLALTLFLASFIATLAAPDGSSEERYVYKFWF